MEDEEKSITANLKEAEQLDAERRSSPRANVDAQAMVD